jgi:hypothetical protein
MNEYDVDRMIDAFVAGGPPALCGHTGVDPLGDPVHQFLPKQEQKNRRTKKRTRR